RRYGTSPHLEGRLGAPAPLAHQPPSLALVETTPHTLLLAGDDGVLEARLTDGADRADLLGRLATVLGLGRRVEELRVGSQTSCVLAPVVRHAIRAFVFRAGERPVGLIQHP